jgi:hypothetical protein
MQRQKWTCSKVRWAGHAFRYPQPGRWADSASQETHLPTGSLVRYRPLYLMQRLAHLQSFQRQAQVPLERWKIEFCLGCAPSRRSHSTKRSTGQYQRRRREREPLPLPHRARPSTRIFVPTIRCWRVRRRTRHAIQRHAAPGLHSTCVRWAYEPAAHCSSAPFS